MFIANKCGAHSSSVGATSLTFRSYGARGKWESFFYKHFAPTALISKLSLRHNLDFFLFALIVAAFVYVAAQRLGTVPIPDSDESMTLQVPYEMLYRGKLAFPMYRFLGGNIEEVWHSYTPLFFVLQSGFMKLFGWGLVEGRAFNLISAALLLLMVYLIGRRLVDWRAGLIAVVMLISDPVFLARSRLARNDMLAGSFGLLAFYLYEIAEERKGKWYYAASGLAAGAGVMCHTNLLYILCVITALMLLKHGWRILKTAKPYLFAAGALAVMAYEIIYVIIDYKNFILQNSRDSVHFRVLELWGWWNNLLAEPRRYSEWYNLRGAKLAPEETLLHIFLYLTIIAIIYLIIRSLLQIRRGNATGEPRVRILVATIVVALFFAAITQRKVVQYTVHLSPWFALGVGILLSDGLTVIGQLRQRRWRWSQTAHSAAVVIVGLLIAAYSYGLVRQTKAYLKAVHDPELATFDEIKAALRSVVPEGVCPVSIASAYLWLAFPEHDQCFFAHMEARLDETLDIDGKDYALFVKPKFLARQRKLTGGGVEKYHLLGELRNTAYGTFYVYYTGSDPRYRALAPKRYYFFRLQRGHISDEQIAAGREVWAATGPKLSEGLADQSGQGEGLIVELNADTVYQVSVDASPGGDWELVILDDGTGARIRPIKSDEQGGKKIFRTTSGNRIRLALRKGGGGSADELDISRISICEIAPV